MFERFTERARVVVIEAQGAARELGHAYIGGEHLLVGCAAEGEGLAAQVLAGRGVTAEALRAKIEERWGRGDNVTTGQIPFTEGAKKALELALREALSLGHNYIGTEHVLLALERQSDSRGVTLLEDFGVHVNELRGDIIRLLSGPGRQRPSRGGDPEISEVREAVGDAQRKFEELSRAFTGMRGGVRLDVPDWVWGMLLGSAKLGRERARRLIEDAFRAAEYELPPDSVLDAVLDRSPDVE